MSGWLQFNLGEWATRERGLWPKHAIKADDPMEEFLDLFDPTKRGGELS